MGQEFFSKIMHFLLQIFDLNLLEIVLAAMLFRLYWQSYVRTQIGFRPKFGPIVIFLVVGPAAGVCTHTLAYRLLTQGCSILIASAGSSIGEIIDQPVAAMVAVSPSQYLAVSAACIANPPLEARLPSNCHSSLVVTLPFLLDYEYFLPSGSWQASSQPSTQSRFRIPYDPSNTQFIGMGREFQTIIQECRYDLLNKAFAY